MNEEDKQRINGYIKKFSEEYNGNNPKIYERIKLQIGKHYFQNSLQQIEANRQQYDLFLKYVSEKLGLVSK